MVRPGCQGRVQDPACASGADVAQDFAVRPGRFAAGPLLHDPQSAAVSEGHRRGTGGLGAHAVRRIPAHPGQLERAAQVAL